MIKAYAHLNLSRKELIKWFIKGGLFLEFTVDYQTKKFTMTKTYPKPANYVEVNHDR